MTCLDDRVLHDLAEGTVADPSARMHLLDCADCRRRQGAFFGDAALVAALLRDGPVPVLRPRAERGATWLPLGVAAAAALLAGVLLLRDGTRPAAEPRRATATDVTIADVSRALFALDDTEWLVEPVRRSELQPLQAALRGEWPCVRTERWTDRGCD